MNKEEIKIAKSLYDSGAVNELYALIKPQIEKEDPYALYFYSTFSFPEWNESEQEFDKRNVDCLTKAADGGVVEAMYRLSSYYLLGDMVEKDESRGEKYLSDAVEQGYGPAKLSYGLYLFYGAYGISENREQGSLLIQQAAEQNVEGAEEALQDISE